MNILEKFCTEFCSTVERHTKYIIVSGFVAIASGRARGTEDIDMIIARMTKEAFSRMHLDLVKKGFVCMQSDSADVIYDDYLTKKVSIRYTYPSKLIPQMEIKFAKDELDTIQIGQRIKIPLTGLDVWFGSPEMNIAYKEEYLKSDKDIEDAKHLRRVFAQEIDERNINECKKLIRKYR